MGHSDTDSAVTGTQEAPSVVSALPRSRVSAFDRRLLLAATAAHFLNDFYVAFLAPLLPLVVRKFGLSLALAGLLATALNTSAAMSQPLFGAIADRLHRKVFVALGPLLTAAAMGFLGLAPTYATLLVVLMIAGTGTASFHPQGASTAGNASGARKGTGLSLFVSGGELGYSLGPLIIALVVATHGLAATWIVAVPGLILAAFLWRFLPSQPAAHIDRPKTSLRADLTGALGPLALLWLIVVLRSIVISAYQTFLPLLLQERGGSIVAGGVAVFLFGGVGALGGLTGGVLSDRIGRKPLLILSMVLGTPLLLAFIQSRGLWAYLFLAAGGIAIYLSAAVTIVMAQELLPKRASVASSIVMGLAWGVAGLSLTGIGALADVVGLTAALTYVLTLMVPAVIAVGTLPQHRASPRIASGTFSGG